MIVFIQIASEEIHQTPLPDVAVMAILLLRITDVRISVVEPYDEE